MEKSRRNHCFHVAILLNYKFDFWFMLSYIQLVLFTSLENSMPFNGRCKRWRLSYKKYD